MIEVLYGIVLALILTFFIVWSERKKFNNGICSKCNTQWIYVETDSQGGRWYRCNCEANNIIWITFPGADKIRV